MCVGVGSKRKAEIGYANRGTVKITRSITAREMFPRFAQVKKKLWGGEFWANAYYVRTVGNDVTAKTPALGAKYLLVRYIIGAWLDTDVDALYPPRSSGPPA